MFTFHRIIFQQNKKQFVHFFQNILPREMDNKNDYIKLYAKNIFVKSSSSWIQSVQFQRSQIIPSHGHLNCCAMKKSDVFAKLTSKDLIYFKKMEPPKEKPQFTQCEIKQMERASGEEDLKEYKNDPDLLITTGVKITCLKNPRTVPPKLWTRNLIELWLCRIPHRDEDTLHLVRMTRFRRYGEDRLFEIECTFQNCPANQEVYNSAIVVPGTKGIQIRRFWIHICLLGHTKIYRNIIKYKIKWCWELMEYKFHELMDGYGSDEEDIKSTESGEVYALMKKQKKDIPEDGNYYKPHNITVVTKLWEEAIRKKK